ncbi:hypothetical protein BIFADO_00494 [Bifidobacterium adolescentis L2-32]|uniref:Uncharacterized protein n=1 Tax=Bifidobacterium adolescentis L2-32 TaxID=411481 RepID=A7A3U7_BIFAD|nr:hypothetical protein BIFADO_00494 [Bifidobacterium adolescentis L2-32]
MFRSVYIAISCDCAAARRGPFQHTRAIVCPGIRIYERRALRHAFFSDAVVERMTGIEPA